MNRHNVVKGESVTFKVAIKGFVPTNTGIFVMKMGRNLPKNESDIVVTKAYKDLLESERDSNVATIHLNPSQTNKAYGIYFATINYREPRDLDEQALVDYPLKVFEVNICGRKE